MANLRNTTEMPAAAAPGENLQTVRDRWSGEVNRDGMNPTWNEPWPGNESRAGTMMQTESMRQMGQMNQMSPMNPMGQMGNMQMNQGNQTGGLQMSRNGRAPQNNGLSMQNNLPSEVIESPTTLNEAYLGSLKAMLVRNKGNYLVATFLIGTQNMVSWEGILYEVGNDYITIYQPGRDRYVVIDMYSLKYMEFYDTQRRELCDQVLRERDWQNSW